MSDAPCPLCVTPPEWLARRATAYGRLTRREAMPAPPDDEICRDHVDIVRGYRKVRDWNEGIYAGKQTRQELREELAAKERTTW